MDSILDKADLSDAIGISNNQFDSAWGDSNTVLPAGCQHPQNIHWQFEETSPAASEDRQQQWDGVKQQRLDEAKKKNTKYPY
jgi:hypothetical protein